MQKIVLPLEAFYQFEKELKQKIYLRQPINGNWIDFTWEQVGKEVRVFASALKNLNLPSQSPIALLSKNCAHWIIADLAIWMAGHISVPLYPTANNDSIEYVLKHCETKVLIAGKLDDWHNQKHGVPEEIKVISFPFWQNEDTITWEHFTQGCEPLKNDFHPLETDIATIIYTSGTTGKPKGVVHSFKSMSAQMRQAIKIIDINPHDRFLSYLPLSHVAERLLVELGSIYCGGSISFVESLDTFKKNLKEVRPTIFLAVPRIWLKFQHGILEKIPAKKLRFLLALPILNNIIRKKIKEQLGLKDCRYAISGAAAISKDLTVWFDRLGIQIEEAYGMTENFGITSFNLPKKIKYGTVGQIWPNTQVKFSEQGEILSKSEANMIGYYKDPENTAKTIDQDGWLYTGDKGILLEDNYLKITGRIKDIFKTSKGKYVAPAKVEDFLSSSELIEHVCVLGANLPQPFALIVLSEAAQKMHQENLAGDFNNLISFVNEKLESHERLQNFIIIKDEWSIESGVLTPTLKIKRNVVESLYGQNFEKWSKTKTTTIFT